MTTDRVLFSTHEVIFDNSASTSVFENPDLLTDSVPSATPTMIGGFQKGAPGVRNDDVGNFRDLGRVGIGNGASCNILSACQMKDTGRAFIYDNDKDEFVVTGRVKIMSSLVVSGTTEPSLVSTHATSPMSP